MIFSATNAGSTNDSTALQSSSTYEVISTRRSWLLEWAITTGDNAFENRMHVMTPYSGRGLT